MLKKIITTIMVLLCIIMLDSCSDNIEESELHNDIQGFAFDYARELILENKSMNEINSLSSEGATCIQECILASQFDGEAVDIIKLLLENGADVNQTGKGEYKKTALDFLMQQSPIMYRNFDEIYAILLDYGAIPTEDTMKNCLAGESQFTYAEKILEILENSDIDTGLSDTMKALVTNESDNKIISLLREERYKKGEKNNIMFLSAAKCGVNVMKTLEEEEFDFTQTTVHRMSLIDIAAAYNSPGMMDYLISIGQDPEASESGYEIMEEDGECDEFVVWVTRAHECESYTSMSFALINGKEKNVNYLLENGSNFQINSWCIACFNGGEKAIDILLEYGFSQEEPYIYECYMMSDNDIVKYLLEKNVDHNVNSIYGENLLESLKETENEERYNLIVSHAE